MLLAWLHENGYISLDKWIELASEKEKTGKSIREILAGDSVLSEVVKCYPYGRE